MFHTEIRGRAGNAAVPLIPFVVVVVVAACFGGPLVSPSASAPAPSSVPPSLTPTPQGPTSPSASASPPSTTPIATSTPEISPTPTASPSSPISTATPSASPPATESATPRYASRLVSHGTRDGRQIALTFDMGGRIGDSVAIMEWLTTHDVAATIFLTGAIIDNQTTVAGRTVLGLVDQHSELFDLGNHSYHHPDFRELTPEQMRMELQTTESAMAQFSDRSPRPLFRPPYGGWNELVLATVGPAGYSRTVLWDVDTIDWRPISDGGPNADQIVDKVLAGAQGGSIVLMHLGGYETLNALPRIVDGLRAAGHELVGLHELLGV